MQKKKNSSFLEIDSYRAIRILGHEHHEGVTTTAEWPELGISSGSVHHVDTGAVTKKKFYTYNTIKLKETCVERSVFFFVCHVFVSYSSFFNNFYLLPILLLCIFQTYAFILLRFLKDYSNLL